MARQGGHILHSAMSFRQLRNVSHDKAKSCNPTTHQSKGDIFETWLARVMLLLSPHCFTDGEHPGSIKLTHLTMPPQLPLPHAALQRFRWYYEDELLEDVEDEDLLACFISGKHRRHFKLSSHCSTNS